MSSAKNSTFMGFHMSTKQLSPGDLPAEYLVRCLEEYSKELVRVSGDGHGDGHGGDGTWVAPQIPVGHADRVQLFIAIQSRYVATQHKLVLASIGVHEAAISGLVVSYINPDPVCEYCATVVPKRCGGKNCYNGVHYSGPNQSIPCSRQLPMIAAPASVNLVDEIKEEDDEDGEDEIVEVRPTKKCASCFSHEQLCYMCDKPYSQRLALMCEFPGCKSMTHRNCEKLVENWNILQGKDNVKSHVCELHDFESSGAQEITRCAACGVHELPSAEITVFFPPPESLDGLFTRCVLCDDAFHFNCQSFYMSCIQCQDNSQLCFHGEEEKVPICETCFEERAGKCSSCAEGDVYPSKEKVIRCNMCLLTYHDGCCSTHTVWKNGAKHVSCDSCWQDGDETETIEDDAMRRKILLRKRLPALITYVTHFMFRVPLIESYFSGQTSLGDLREQLPSQLFFRFYVPWETFDKKAKVIHEKALGAGAALPPHHSDDDVKYIIMAHVASFAGVIMRPWEHALTVAQWRATIGL